MIERSPDLQERDGKILETILCRRASAATQRASVLEFRDAAADKTSATPVTPFTGLMLNELRYSNADVDFTKLRKNERPYSELALAAAAKSKN